MLPNRDSKGRKVILFRASAVDASSKSSGYDSLILNLCSYETLLEDEENQIRGIVHVVDASGVGMSHFTIFPPQKYYRLGKQIEVN